MSAGPVTELELVRRKLEELEVKAQKYEQLAQGADPQAAAAYWNVFVALQQQIVALQQQIVEQQKKENLLLSSQPADDKTLAGIANIVENVLEKRLEPLLNITLRVYFERYLDHHASSASGGTQRSKDFRKVLLDAYRPDSDTATDHETWCPVTGMWWPTFALLDKSAQYVRAAHLFKRAAWADDWNKLMPGESVDDPLMNGLPMMTAVEQRFDKLQLIILPSAVSLEHPKGDYKVYILDPELMDTKPYDKFRNMYKEKAGWAAPSAGCKTKPEGWHATEISFRQLHGRSMQFGSVTTRPPRRILTWHANLALMHAKLMGWNLPAGAPRSISIDHPGWASPTVVAKLEQTALWHLSLAQPADAPSETATPSNDSYLESDAE